jgi:hypothetical protein
MARWLGAVARSMGKEGENKYHIWLGGEWKRADAASVGSSNTQRIIITKDLGGGRADV